LRLANQSWHSGSSDPAQVRRIFALAGRAAGSIGDEAARLSFRRWLYLEPAMGRGQCALKHQPTQRHSANHQLSETHPLEQRFRDARLVTGIAFVDSGLAAIIATVLRLCTHGESAVQVSMTGRSVVWSISF
jgi:hypothetical protein